VLHAYSCGVQQPGKRTGALQESGRSSPKSSSSSVSAQLLMLTLGPEKMARSSSAERSALKAFLSFFLSSDSFDVEELFFFFLVSRAAKTFWLVIMALCSVPCESCAVYQAGKSLSKAHQPASSLLAMPALHSSFPLESNKSFKPSGHG
jgi:hypothetical protein